MQKPRNISRVRKYLSGARGLASVQISTQARVLLIFSSQDLAFNAAFISHSHVAKLFFDPPTIPFSVRCSWLGFRHPFSTIWLPRRSGLARLSLQDRNLEVLWITWLCPDSGQSYQREIQNRGVQASPRNEREICIHEFLAILKYILSYFLLILWAKSVSYLISLDVWLCVTIKPHHEFDRSWVMDSSPLWLQPLSSISRSAIRIVNLTISTAAPHFFPNAHDFSMNNLVTFNYQYLGGEGPRYSRCWIPLLILIIQDPDSIGEFSLPSPWRWVSDLA